MTETPLIYEFKVLKQQLLSPKLCEDLECDFVTIDTVPVERHSKRFVVGEGTRKYYWFPKVRLALTESEMQDLVNSLRNEYNSKNNITNIELDNIAPVT